MIFGELLLFKLIKDDSLKFLISVQVHLSLDKSGDEALSLDKNGIG